CTKPQLSGVVMLVRWERRSWRRDKCSRTAGSLLLGLVMTELPRLRAGDIQDFRLRIQPAVILRVCDKSPPHRIHHEVMDVFAKTLVLPHTPVVVAGHPYASSMKFQQLAYAPTGPRLHHPHDVGERADAE